MRRLAVLATLIAAAALGAAGSASAAVDPTQTTLTCTPATVPVNASTTCTATVSDATNVQQPTGQVSFSSVPAGAFSRPSVCQWQPSPPGGSATCGVTFTPGAAGTYTLTAGYGGDDFHAASQGSFSIGATTTPAGGGPGSHPGSPPSVTVPVSNGPPPPGTLTIARRAVVRRGRAALKLSCAGSAGSRCVGALALIAHVKKRVLVSGTRRHGHFRTRIVPRQVGSVNYSIAARGSRAFEIKLSRQEARKVARASKRGLRVLAVGLSPIHASVTLLSKGKKPRRHKRHKHKKKT